MPRRLRDEQSFAGQRRCGVDALGVLPGAGTAATRPRHDVTVLLFMSFKDLDTPGPLQALIAQRDLELEVAHFVGGVMALRWCAAGMIEARGQFRRVNGHLHLPALRAALEAHVAAETVGATSHDEEVNAA